MAGRTLPDPRVGAAGVLPILVASPISPCGFRRSALVAAVGLITVGAPVAVAVLGEVDRVRVGPPSARSQSHQEGERTCELVVPFAATVVGS